MRLFTPADDARRARSVAAVRGFKSRPLVRETRGSSGGSGGSYGGDRGGAADALVIEVERAIGQILRRPSTSAGPLALDGAFPDGASRAIDGLVDPSAAGLPAEQAVLARRTRAAVDDVLPVLRGIRPRSTDVNADEIEVLRKAITRSLERITEEVSRPDGPRSGLVDALLDDLASGTGTVATFRAAVEQDAPPGLASVGDEVQTADLDYIDAVVDSIDDAWRDYLAGAGDGLLGRLTRAARFLEVVGRTTRNVEVAAEDAGFSDAERRVTPFLPDDPDSLTFADFLDWTARVAGPDGVRTVTELGEPGLQAVGREAEQLWLLLDKRFGEVGYQAYRDGGCAGEVDTELRALYAQLDQLLNQV